MENPDYQSDIQLDYTIVKEEYSMLDITDNPEDEFPAQTDSGLDNGEQMIQFEITEIDQVKEPLELKEPDQLMCLVCEATFEHLPALQKHMLKHTNTTLPYNTASSAQASRFPAPAISPGHSLNKTSEVDESDDHSEVARKVQELMDSRKNKLQCPVCKKRFKQERNVVNHVTVHISLKPFACQECGKTFRRKDYLKSHIDYVHKSSLMRCPKCEVTLKNMGVYKKHILHCRASKTRKTSKTNLVKCKICKKTYKNTKNLDKHIAIDHIYHEESDEPVEPEVWFEFEKKTIKKEKTQPKLNQLTNREKTKVLNERRFKCSTCFLKFKRKDHLRTHMETHDDIRSIISCKACGQTYLHKRSLQHHLRGSKCGRTHNHRPSFSCDLCSVSFRTKLMLARHYKICLENKSRANPNGKISIKSEVA
ncbi:zinc finger protein 319-like isoform X2 [Phlebotomus argentipes]|uniref:zinc finger protein 319-like isoform X2 n=1 Tax=Phlebotomus argentipes TaxID=94469 RepID=UPI002892A4CB|nr:zinc finger protein 319-like isoform X2 [Phlebotomus argentipes]